MLTLDVLKVLAHTGQPLNLQVTQNPQRPDHHIVSNNSGRSCQTRVRKFGNGRHTGPEISPPPLSQPRHHKRHPPGRPPRSPTKQRSG